MFKSKQSDSPREARGTKKTRSHLAPQHKHNESKLELPFDWSGWCSNHFVCIFTDSHLFNSMHRCWPPCSRVWASCQRRVHISLASLVLISRLTLLKILISYVDSFLNISISMYVWQCFDMLSISSSPFFFFFSFLPSF